MKLFYAIILFSFTVFSTTYGQNLITNPSAELDPVTNGWTQSSGNWQRRTGTPTAQQGTYYFFAGASASTVELYQDVDVSSYSTNIDLGTQAFDFIGYMRDYNGNDESKIIIEYRDASSTVLSTYDSGFRKITSWTLYCDNRTAPANTRTIRIRLQSKRNAGTNSDGYIDDLTLNAITATGNLIANPSCECPPLINGWTQSSGNWTQRSATPDPQHGSQYFYAGAAGGTVELYQDVDVSSYSTEIDDGSQDFSFSGYLNSYIGQTDSANIIVEYRNSSSTVLFTYTTGFYGAKVWGSFSDIRTAPANTRTIRIRLQSKRQVGSNSDGYTDNLSLTAISSPLAIDLLYFNAEWQDNNFNTVKLSWATGLEIDSDYFTVERTKDGRKWEEIATIPASGFSSSRLIYSTVDDSQLTGISFYRLKQTDFNGNFHYSQMRSVNKNEFESSDMAISPNPATNYLTVIGNEDELASIKMYNASGLDVTAKIKISGSDKLNRQIDISSLESGMYILRTKTTVNKVIKY